MSAPTTTSRTGVILLVGTAAVFVYFVVRGDPYLHSDETSGRGLPIGEVNAA